MTIITSEQEQCEKNTSREDYKRSQEIFLNPNDPGIETQEQSRWAAAAERSNINFKRAILQAHNG